MSKKKAARPASRSASKTEIRDHFEEVVEVISEKLSKTNIQADELPELAARFSTALTVSVEAASDRKIDWGEVIRVAQAWKAFGASWKAARAD